MPYSILPSLPCQQQALGKTCGCDVTSHQDPWLLWGCSSSALGSHPIRRWLYEFGGGSCPFDDSNQSHSLVSMFSLSPKPGWAAKWCHCPLPQLLSPAASGDRRYLPPFCSPRWAVTPANIFLAAPRSGSQTQNIVVGYSPQMSFSVYVSPYQGLFLTPTVSGFGGGRAMSWGCLRYPFSSRRAGAFRCQTAP